MEAKIFQSVRFLVKGPSYHYYKHRTLGVTLVELVLFQMLHFLMHDSLMFLLTCASRYPPYFVVCCLFGFDQKPNHIGSDLDEIYDELTDQSYLYAGDVFL